MELFNKLGQLDTSKVSEADVEAMTEDQRSAFFECIRACQATENAEARERAAVILTREKMQAQVSALEAHTKANPPQTRIEAMREVQAAQNGTPIIKAAPKSHPKHAIKAPRLAYEKSELELTEARAELYAAQADVRRLRPISADALSKFMATFRQLSAMDLHRQVIAGQQAERLRRIEAGLTPEPVKPEPVHQWPISKALAGNGQHKRPTFGTPRR